MRDETGPTATAKHQMAAAFDVAIFAFDASVFAEAQHIVGPTRVGKQRQASMGSIDWWLESKHRWVGWVGGWDKMGKRESKHRWVGGVGGWACGSVKVDGSGDAAVKREVCARST